MLISHPYKFIYLKTKKTAGTAIEIYFERYCVEPGTYTGEQNHRAAVVSKWGVIGFRGPRPGHPTWNNHMRAEQVRQLVGDEVWNSYFRFCAIRNPYDRVVSQFWFKLAPEERTELEQADFAEVRSRFRAWVQKARLYIDGPIYSINGIPDMNEFIRYESLHPDMERVCRNLAIPWEVARLGRYKAEHRVRHEHFSAYYDKETEAHVRDTYQWEIEHFGYSNH